MILRRAFCTNSNYSCRSQWRVAFCSICWILFQLLAASSALSWLICWDLSKQSLSEPSFFLQSPDYWPSSQYILVPFGNFVLILEIPLVLTRFNNCSSTEISAEKIELIFLDFPYICNIHYHEIMASKNAKSNSWPNLHFVATKTIRRSQPDLTSFFCWTIRRFGSLSVAGHETLYKYNTKI